MKMRILLLSMLRLMNNTVEVAQIYLNNEINTRILQLLFASLSH